MSDHSTPDYGTGIYSIENTITGADYIGGTATSFQARWKRHKQELRAGWHTSKRLQRDWRKYGEQAFVFTVIERIEDPDTIWERERYWISFRLQYCTPEENYNTVMHKRMLERATTAELAPTE
jgi:group I intron endonuclease